MSSSTVISSSFVPDDSKRAAVDPDGASLDENIGSLRAAPSNGSTKSSSSPRNYRISTVDGDESVMTETEVSNLVHKALRRARKSTSPRKSPKSSSFDAASTTSVAPLEPVAKSPQRDREEFDATPEDATFSPCDDFHDLLAPSHDSISLAPKPSQDDSATAVSTNSKAQNLNASDAVIRRVEEEIASARKAAEAASARLSTALSSGSRDTSSINDWRSSNVTNDWQEHDATAITMKPSMDINDILNDHLADDEEFQVVAGSSFADDDHLSEYLRGDAARVIDEEFALRPSADSESQKLEQLEEVSANYEESSDADNQREKTDGIVSDHDDTSGDLSEDERRHLEGEAKEIQVEERVVDFEIPSSSDKVDTESEPEATPTAEDSTNEQPIEPTATGEASLQSSTIAPISVSTAEISEDQELQKNSTASGEATSSGEDFAAESYETAEEDLPFPMDREKGTPVTEDETTPTTKTKDMPEAETETEQLGLNKVLDDAEHGVSTDSKSHPAIGSEIFLSSQNMDAAASQVENDEASEYTEETISDEESDYTEVTIHDTDTGATSDKSVDQSKSEDVQTEKSTQGRSLVEIPEEESTSAPVSPPAVQKTLSPWDQLPDEELSKPALSIVDETTVDNNDIMDKLENARKELEKPTEASAPTMPKLEEKPAVPVKSGPRRVTLSIITQPIENDYGADFVEKPKRFGTPKTDDRPRPVDIKSKDDVTKRTKVSFRSPYPPPPPLVRRRSAEDIIAEFREPSPELCSVWLRPKMELKQLLLAAMGTSLPRRSNACGALKVLSMKTKKNKLTLVKTDGFLSALVFAMCDDIPIKDRDVALDARTRAVTTILNVVEPKENRTIVFAYPGLAEALVKVITDDRGEARVHACQTVAILAKTAACREQIPKVEGLVDVLAKVVQKTIDNSVMPLEEEKKEESFEDEEGNHGSSSYSEDEGSTDGSDDGSNTDGETTDDSSLPPQNAAAATAAGRLQSIRKTKHNQLAEFAAQARVSACAALTHLSKHCSISNQLCANQCLIECLIAVSCEFENPIHTKCVEMITNLTRFPANNEVMAQQPELLEALVKCGKSKILADRVWALRSLQNMSADSGSKVTLASSTILTLLSVCAVRRDYEERIPAVAALFNISTEPGAVVPLTNTRNVVATLVHLAHNSESSPEIRHMACDALATIGLWLQTLAGTGSYPEGVKKVPLPSHATTGWQIWN